MNKTRSLKFLALVSALLMALSLVGCQSATVAPTAAATTVAPTAADTAAPTADQTPTTKSEPVQLTYLYQGTDTRTNPDADSAVMKYFADKTGALVKFTYADQDKYNALIAAGDMGCDITNPNSNQQLTLAKNDMMLPLESLLPTYGKDILTNAATPVKYWEQFKSNGTGHLYWLMAQNLPNLDEVAKAPVFEFQVGPEIRWDLYAKLGYPAINNENDLLNVLKQMQDANPKTADGKKTYAMSYWTDWGTVWQYSTMYMFGYGQELMYTVLGVDTNGDYINDITSKDFGYWNAMRFYNKAYNMGIFDPESFTQKAANAEDKIKNGQVFFNYHGWSNTALDSALMKNFGDTAGLGLAINAFPHLYNGGQSAITGWGFASGIMANSKHPNEALTWLNYFYTEDGARTEESGIQGVNWNVVDGVPTLTDETIQKFGSDKAWTEASGMQVLHNWTGLNDYWVCKDGAYANLFCSAAMIQRSNTAFTKSYNDHFGVKYPGEAALNAAKDGKITIDLYNNDDMSMVPTEPDDIKKIDQKINNLLDTNTAELIMCKPDQLEAKISALIEQAKASGAQQVIDWFKTNLADSKAKVAQFK